MPNSRTETRRPVELTAAVLALFLVGTGTRDPLSVVIAFAPTTTSRRCHIGRSVPPPTRLSASVNDIPAVGSHSEDWNTRSKMAQILEDQERRPPTPPAPSKMSLLAQEAQQSASLSRSPRELVNGPFQPWVNSGNRKLTAAAASPAAPAESMRIDDAPFEARLKYEQQKRQEAEEEARRLKAEHDNYTSMNQESKAKAGNISDTQHALEAREKELEKLHAELNKAMALRRKPSPPSSPPPTTIRTDEELAAERTKSKKLGMELAASNVALDGLAKALHEEVKKSHLANAKSGESEQNLNAVAQEVENSERRVQETKATLAERSNEVYALKCEMGLLKAKLNKSDMAGAELRWIKKALDEKVAELSEWKTRADTTIREREVCVARLEKDLDEVRRSVAATSSNDPSPAVLSATEVDELLAWKVVAEAKIKEHEDDVVSLTEELIRREGDVEDGRRSIQAISVSEVNLSEEIRDLREWKRDAEAAITQYGKDMLVLRAQLESLKAASAASDGGAGKTTDGSAAPLLSSEPSDTVIERLPWKNKWNRNRKVTVSAPMKQGPSISA